ncbi:MAG: hypothetical protein AABW82_02590 [Nanoarchaeota archaeon]
MITRDYNDTFHGVLKYGAVASAEAEFLGAEEASRGNLSEAQSHFRRAQHLKDGVQKDLSHAHREIHYFIGSYDSLLQDDEAGPFLRMVARAGEDLEGFVHDAHIQTSLDMLSERHQRLREERIDTVAE